MAASFNPCFRCFPNKKPSGWEFFVPAGSDFAAKLLTTIWVPKSSGE